MLINSHNFLTNFGGTTMLQKKMIMSIFILICFFGFSFAQSSTKVGIGVAIIDMQQFFEAFASEGGSFNSAIMVPIEMSLFSNFKPKLDFPVPQTSGPVVLSLAKNRRHPGKLGLGF